MTTEHDTLEQRLARRDRGGFHRDGPPNGLAPRSDGVEALAIDIVDELLGASPVTVGGQMRRKEHLDYIVSKLRAHLAPAPGVVEALREAAEDAIALLSAMPNEGVRVRCDDGFKRPKYPAKTAVALWDALRQAQGAE